MPQVDIRVRVVPPFPGFQYRDTPEALYNSTDPTFLADGSTAGFVEVSVGTRQNWTTLCLHESSEPDRIAQVVCRQLDAYRSGIPADKRIRNGTYGLDLKEINKENYKKAFNPAELNDTDTDYKEMKQLKFLQGQVPVAPYVQVKCDGSEPSLNHCGFRLGLETSDDCYKCHKGTVIYDQKNGQPDMDFARLKEIELCVTQNERQLFVRCAPNN